MRLYSFDLTAEKDYTSSRDPFLDTIEQYFVYYLTERREFHSRLNSVFDFTECKKSYILSDILFIFFFK